MARRQDVRGSPLRWHEEDVGSSRAGPCRLQKYGTAHHSKNKVRRTRMAEAEEEKMLPSLLAKARTMAEKERLRLLTIESGEKEESEDEVEEGETEWETEGDEGDE